MLVRTKKAFTMLELIVVIVILGILAAIAIPTFAKVIEKSKLSSLRQTASAVDRDALALAAFENRASTTSDVTGVVNGDASEVKGHNALVVTTTGASAAGTVEITRTDAPARKVCLTLSGVQGQSGTVTDGGCAPSTTSASSYGMPGNAFPAGTVTTATAEVSPASSAIDKDLTTGWNNGPGPGTLTLDPTGTLTLSALHIMHDVSPSTTQTVVIEGLSGGTWSQLSSTSVALNKGDVKTYPFTTTTVDAVRITISGGSSWIAILETTWS